ncbi:hypothetical protein ALC60_01167 [Trachymyrmex zeteki]|uniref:Uncharacterized protein n=1 Tax=Mycetomoellerius zeteki TaxID=64791 RepID=A0A151XHA0_9HYME|nr:hypothetical protein ALC60_01167 [Trachymyrmex zeteki]
MGRTRRKKGREVKRGDGQQHEGEKARARGLWKDGNGYRCALERDREELKFRGSMKTKEDKTGSTFSKEARGFCAWAKESEGELEKLEKSINKKLAEGRRRRKGRRGSIHSNSVVKATACPTARRYLWGGFWVASVAADVTADRVPPPPRCPLFCFCSSASPLPYVDPFSRSDTVRERRNVRKKERCTKKGGIRILMQERCRRERSTRRETSWLYYSASTPARPRNLLSGCQFEPNLETSIGSTNPRHSLSLSLFIPLPFSLLPIAPETRAGCSLKELSM